MNVTDRNNVSIYNFFPFTRLKINFQFIVFNRFNSKSWFCAGYRLMSVGIYIRYQQQHTSKRYDTHIHTIHSIKYRTYFRAIFRFHIFHNRLNYEMEFQYLIFVDIVTLFIYVCDKLSPEKIENHQFVHFKIQSFVQ